MVYPFHGRRLARVMAIESIYSSELMGLPLEKTFRDVIEERRSFFERVIDNPRDHDVKTEKQLNRFRRDLENWEQIVDFASRIIESYSVNKEAVEKAIKENLEGIDYDRIFNVEKSILKAATAEMMGMDTDYKVVISEAIKIANDLSTDKAAKMINAILDRIAEYLNLKETVTETGEKTS